MNVIDPVSIEDYVIHFLQKESLSGAVLLGKIQHIRPNTTKQALYAALRKLRTQEIVIMHNMRISLSTIWLRNMIEFFQIAKHVYIKSITTDEGFLNLEDGDRVMYSFKNPNIADIFWGHAFEILAEITSVSAPAYVYNPHEWFMLARPETEKSIFKKIAQSGKQILVLAGGATFLDKSIIKEFDGTIAQYHPTDEDIFEKRNYYLNIFDDFIIEAYLDEKITKKIDWFYESTEEWTLEKQNKLRDIIALEGKNKLTISRNKKRSDKLKKMFNKYFYVKNLNN